MRLLFVALVAALSASPALAQDALKKYVHDQVLHARYMSPDGGCKQPNAGIGNWAASELQECTYEVTDNRNDGTHLKKKGYVFLANPSPDQVYAWLKTGCALVQPGNADKCVRDAADYILDASGAQFPVAGVVWEDQSCGDPHGKCIIDAKGNKLGDGIYEAYIFRNGVTVRVDKFDNGSTAPVDGALEDLALHRPVIGIHPDKGYARIMSTDRQSFARYARRQDIPTGEGSKAAALTWSGIIGDTYRAALHANDNPLIGAKLCDLHGWPKPCPGP